MTPSKDAKKRVSDLLAQLSSQPDAASVTLEGKATSRSDNCLHLAVATGIVAIPLSEIEDVVPVNLQGDPTLVSVVVRDNAKVRHLLKVQPTVGGEENLMHQSARGVQAARGFGGFGGGFSLPPIFACASFTNEYHDTTTASRGVVDATDDVIPFLQCDDHSV